ncbi:MAG: response regulator [Oscillospiraceae bacterium]
MGNLILVVEDEKAIVDILRFNLKKEGYEVAAAFDGEDGLSKALSISPDLILLDVMLPKLNGFEICKRMRSGGSNTPIIMLTAREEERDKVLGLDLGADDYITKPFSMRELLARVKANLRRTRLIDSKSTEEDTITAGGLYVNRKSYEVRRDGQLIELTAREFELLCFLASSPDTVFSREELMEKVWNYGYVGDARTVDVTVRRLREKLEINPAEPEYIVTRRGAGYYFASHD